MDEAGDCGIPDNRPMPSAQDPVPHWVVPFAALGAEGQHPDWPALPRLQALLPRLREQQRDRGEHTDPTLPHERAIAAARGLALADHAWPGAALHSAQPHEPQAWVHPVHLQVGMDQVTLQPAELFGLDEAASRRLFEAFAPLCAEDGLALHFDSPVRWRASGERLRGLRCASLDRVAGRSIAPWQPQGSEARWLQRLMNEAQMLFYTHPVNDAREAARQPAVNGLWFSAAGAVDAGVTPGPAPTVADDLRASALGGDAAAWRAAWQALDARLVPDLQALAQQGRPFALTLCGERSAVTLQPHTPSPWQGLARALGLARAPQVAELLETL